MARPNSKGQELAWHGPSKRWCKTIDGNRKYFGYGRSRSDRKSYKVALEKYREFMKQRRREDQRQIAGQILAAVLTDPSHPDGSTPEHEFQFLANHERPEVRAILQQALNDAACRRCDGSRDTSSVSPHPCSRRAGRPKSCPRPTSPRKARGRTSRLRKWRPTSAGCSGRGSRATQRLNIRNYVVVNGAQSITTFRQASDYLSENLRVIAKIIQLNDDDLSRKITINSNNQNAIKPRDLKSNNEIQVRLQEEFGRVEDGKYDLEIKRGQSQRDNATLITNEEAGRLLLAFDLMRPESCHQVYKLFDDMYAEIFARPVVTAHRIIFLHLIMGRITGAMTGIEYKPLSKYGLTRFFLLSVVAELIKGDDGASAYLKDPAALFENGKVERFMDGIGEIVDSLIVDLNYEVRDAGEQFDYKGDLKSPSKVRDLRNKLLRSYEKDVARKKCEPLSALIS